MNLTGINLNFVFAVLKKYTCTSFTKDHDVYQCIKNKKKMKTRNIARIIHQWCLQMRAKAFNSRVGWGAFKVLTWNGVFF